MGLADDTGLLGDLDVDQRAAVTTPSTLVAVIAAAGSGKTRVLTRRIAYRVATGTADARHTLALTFTREAAGELRRRLRASGLRESIEAGTFHSVALGVLRQRWRDEGRPAPNIAGDRHRLLAAVTERVPVDTLAAERTWCAARGVAPRAYPDAAREANRRCGVRPADVAAALIAYDELKRRRGVIDLDDLLLVLDHELATDRAFADVVRWRFRHVYVDEAQDLNPLQHRLLHHVVDDLHDLFLVGDPAQAIYAFNGPDPSLLIDVDRHFAGIEVVRLATNRRCTPQIVAAGVHVLRRGGQESDAVAARPDGVEVTVHGAPDEHAEAALVARLVASMSPSHIRRGDIAVLARTHEQLATLRPVLDANGVPVQRRSVTPGTPLAAAIGMATAQTSASSLRAWAHDVLDATPPQSAAHASEVDAAERRVAAAVLDFLREQPLGDGYALRTWIAANNPFATPGADRGVELLTFHAAKGREWHTVVVAGVETGLVPHRSATTNAGRAEEARLLHVAMTRASDRMIVTYAGRRRGYARQASPLIAELPTDPPPVIAPVPTIDTTPDVVALRTRSLLEWRQSVARASAMLPEEVCSERDLVAIAAAPPATPEELTARTSLGPITAAKVFAPIRSALDAVGSP